MICDKKIKRLIHAHYGKKTPTLQIRKHLYECKYAPMTIYIDNIPSVSDWLTKLQKITLSHDKNPAISLIYGYSICDYRDNFDKKIGRERAIANSKLTDFFVNYIEFKAVPCIFSVNLSTNDLKNDIRLDYYPDGEKNKLKISFFTVNDRFLVSYEN